MFLNALDKNVCSAVGWGVTSVSTRFLGFLGLPSPAAFLGIFGLKVEWILGVSFCYCVVPSVSQGSVSDSSFCVSCGLQTASPAGHPLGEGGGHPLWLSKTVTRPAGLLLSSPSHTTKWIPLRAWSWTWFLLKAKSVYISEELNTTCLGTDRCVQKCHCPFW